MQVRLVDDLLDVSRIVVEKLVLDCRQLDITSIAVAAVDTARPAAEAKQLSLDANIDDYGRRFTPTLGCAVAAAQRDPGLD